LSFSEGKGSYGFEHSKNHETRLFSWVFSMGVNLFFARNYFPSIEIYFIFAEQVLFVLGPKQDDPGGVIWISI